TFAAATSSTPKTQTCYKQDKKEYFVDVRFTQELTGAWPKETIKQTGTVTTDGPAQDVGVILTGLYREWEDPYYHDDTMYWIFNNHQTSTRDFANAYCKDDGSIDCIRIDMITLFVDNDEVNLGDTISDADGLLLKSLSTNQVVTANGDTYTFRFTSACPSGYYETAAACKAAKGIDCIQDDANHCWKSPNDKYFYMQYTGTTYNYDPGASQNCSYCRSNSSSYQEVSIYKNRADIGKNVSGDYMTSGKTKVTVKNTLNSKQEVKGVVKGLLCYTPEITCKASGSTNMCQSRKPLSHIALKTSGVTYNLCHGDGTTNNTFADISNCAKYSANDTTGNPCWEFDFKDGATYTYDIVDKTMMTCPSGYFGSKSTCESSGDGLIIDNDLVEHWNLVTNQYKYKTSTTKEIIPVCKSENSCYYPEYAALELEITIYNNSDSVMKGVQMELVRIENGSEETFYYQMNNDMPDIERGAIDVPYVSANSSFKRKLVVQAPPKGTTYKYKLKARNRNTSSTWSVDQTTIDYTTRSDSLSIDLWS
ncbi:MAG: hypothetical protein NC311_14070, partial [Muribaculaceae bacterium]|nr:hypothetical protein [Muribaculaceae bacterium]